VKNACNPDKLAWDASTARFPSENRRENCNLYLARAREFVRNFWKVVRRSREYRKGIYRTLL
jgi:hypothetical protein